MTHSNAPFPLSHKIFTAQISIETLINQFYLVPILFHDFVYRIWAAIVTDI